MMRRGQFGIRVLCSAGLAMLACGPALAQSKDLSDKSVLILMQYAWGFTPAKFTTPQGKVIEVDKSKPSAVIVPVETAREVIRVARLSAYAQLCELPEEQVANYQTLMRREEAKSKWTDQQLLYMSQLHLFTLMTMTGKVQLVEKDGDKQVVLQEGKPVKTESCTETERQKVKSQITAYVTSNPPPAPAAAAAAPQVPGKSAAPGAKPVQPVASQQGQPKKQ